MLCVRACRIILRAMREERADGAHSRLQQVIQFLSADQYSLELKVAAMTLLNALINYTPALAARKEFRDELNIWETVAVCLCTLCVSSYIC